jgi:integral membrane sensor domain MASE1
MVFFFIIWAALRLGQHGATLTTFIISGIAILGTARGQPAALMKQARS